MFSFCPHFWRKILEESIVECLFNIIFSSIKNAVLLSFAFYHFCSEASFQTYYCSFEDIMCLFFHLWPLFICFSHHVFKYGVLNIHLVWSFQNFLRPWVDLFSSAFIYWIDGFYHIFSFFFMLNLNYMWWPFCFSPCILHSLYTFHNLG